MPWTPYAELDRLLAELVADVRAALGDNLCGAYLRGPFAVGDADEHSDVDFIVVTQHELSEGEQAAFTSCTGGSASAMSSGRSTRKARTSRRSDYAASIRRAPRSSTSTTARERGVVLAGPAPTTLVRDAVAETMQFVDHRVGRRCRGRRMWFRHEAGS